LNTIYFIQEQNEYKNNPPSYDEVINEKITNTREIQIPSAPSQLENTSNSHIPSAPPQLDYPYANQYQYSYNPQIPYPYYYPYPYPYNPNIQQPPQPKH